MLNKKTIIFLIIMTIFFVSLPKVNAVNTAIEDSGSLSDLSPMVGNEKYSLYSGDGDFNMLEKNYVTSANTLMSCAINMADHYSSISGDVEYWKKVSDIWKTTSKYCLSNDVTNFKCGSVVLVQLQNINNMVFGENSLGNYSTGAYLDKCSEQKKSYSKAKDEMFEYLADHGELDQLDYYGTSLRACRIFGSNFYKILRTSFNFIKVAAVIALIVFGMIDFTKATMSSEADVMKKSIKNFTNRMIATVIIFLLPYLLDFILSSVNGTGFTSCISGF